MVPAAGLPNRSLAGAASDGASGVRVDGTDGIDGIDGAVGAGAATTCGSTADGDGAGARDGTLTGGTAWWAERLPSVAGAARTEDVAASDGAVAAGRTGEAGASSVRRAAGLSEGLMGDAGAAVATAGTTGSGRNGDEDTAGGIDDAGSIDGVDGVDGVDCDSVGCDSRGRCDSPPAEDAE